MQQAAFRWTCVIEGRLMNGDVDGVPVHGARLLVVEDDPEQRDMLARALRSRGYRVRTCGSASEAILLAPAVEVVLLDVRLPDRSGWARRRPLERATHGHVRRLRHGAR